jgi:hypothetical protein
MTRVELTYGLTRPLAETDYERLSRLMSTYGVMGFQLPENTVSSQQQPDNPEEPGTMIIEYDATRFSPEGVDRVVRMSGLPLRRISL